MRFFFRSRQFKIIIAAVAAVVAVAVLSAIIGATMAPQANLAGTIAAPFRSLITNISNSISDIGRAYSDNNKLLLENAELESENAELRNKLAEYDKAIYQNEFYKDYLEIKEKNPDFKFVDASVISRDFDDPYGGFVINKGSLSHIKKYDTVITDKGLIGYITEVGLSTSKVTTVLSSEITLGALDSRTNDSGIISGNIELAKEGRCKLYNLSRSCNVAIGDYIVTSGEGIFPDGLIVGSIETIGSDKYNTSIYATVKPFVDMDEVRAVMVITDFEGKGGVMQAKGDK